MCATEATASLGVQPEECAIDVEKLAEIVGAEIEYGHLDGAKARVVQIGDPARIISKSIVGVGAIRFCIAHEIGHLLLKHCAQGDALGRAFKRQRTCEPLASGTDAIVRHLDVGQHDAVRRVDDRALRGGLHEATAVEVVGGG